MSFHPLVSHHPRSEVGFAFAPSLLSGSHSFPDSWKRKPSVTTRNQQTHQRTPSEAWNCKHCQNGAALRWGGGFSLAPEPYHEARGRGALRYLLFQVERHTGLVQLSLVWNAKTLPRVPSGLRP